MITKLKWQWQSSTNDLADLTSHTSSTRTTTSNQRGRVITGMLTGGDQFQDPAKSKGRCN